MKNTHATIRDIANQIKCVYFYILQGAEGCFGRSSSYKKGCCGDGRLVIVPEIALHFFSSAISGMQEAAALHG